MAPPCKRQRRSDEGCSRCAKRKHLYLVLDDWKGGYSIHKLDADDMPEDHLPEPAALRVAKPERGPVAFFALGTSIFVATNAYCNRGRAPPLLVYDAATGALTVGPRLPAGQARDLGAAMVAGERLYAITSVWSAQTMSSSASLEVLSWARNAVEDREPWDPAMAWSWKSSPAAAPPPLKEDHVVSYAVHPDGRTVFVSSWCDTDALDTCTGAWTSLGDWALPFRGRAYFDGDLNAFVGLHRLEDGTVCCCPVPSRSGTATRPLECKMLGEKLCLRREEDPKHWGCLKGKETTLTYLGDSRFCLVENILRGEHAVDGAVVHVTVFGLMYDQNGELQTKVRRITRSYEVAKNTSQFSHAAFWI